MRMPYHQQCMGQSCSVLAYRTHLGWAAHGYSFSGLEKHPQPAVHDRLRVRGLSGGGTAGPLWHPCLPRTPSDPALQGALTVRQHVLAALAAEKPLQAACWLNLICVEALAKVANAAASQVWGSRLAVTLHLAAAI